MTGVVADAAELNDPAVSHIAVPAQAQPIITVAEVKVGMKGYGMTVFHGDTIEPFAVEVVSILPTHSPKHSTVWVRCPDERMQKSGPVRGMSGSPIYLWDEGEEQTLGNGGRLLGAFAFGHPFTNDCMVGVQPIEYMREVAQRATAEDRPDWRLGSRRPELGATMLANLSAVADGQQMPAYQRFRLDAVRRLMTGMSPQVNPQAATSGGGGGGGGVQPLLLPMNTGSEALSRWMSPMLEPLGLSAQASGEGIIAGAPPSYLDPQTVKLRPGSVLSIPLAFGDADLSAAGTVTDVLPDGTVLGFGHAMEGTGPTALPMSTGYVHYIASLITASFKRSGSLQLTGTMLQDEKSAVAGTMGRSFTTAPVRVAVEMPGQPRRDYRFEVVNHPSYTAAIAPMVMLAALDAVQAPPMYNTTRLAGTLSFSHGRSIKMDTLVPMASPQALAPEIAPMLIAPLTGEVEPLELESADVTMTVEQGVKLSFLRGLTVTPTAVKPGETVTLTLDVQPFGGEVTKVTLLFELPMDVPQGEFDLVVGDAGSWLQRVFRQHPQWQVIDSGDELFEALRRINEVKRDAVYASLILPEGRVIAVSDRTLPGLPSSRRAILAGSMNSTTAMPALASVDRSYPMQDVTAGEVSVKLTVLPRD